MSETLSFVRETDATGETAALFADIRTTLGNGSVNLIWRHLATMPGALAPIWTAVRPIHAAGAARPAAMALSGAMAATCAGARWPEPVIDNGTDVRGAALAVVLSYNRGNAFNLLTLGALLSEPSDQALVTASAWPPPFAPAKVELPAIPELDDLPAALRAQVLAINAIGSPASTQGIVATLYKHIAVWPSVLARAHDELGSMHASGELSAGIEHARSLAATASASLAGLRGPLPGDSAVEAGLDSVRRFVDGLIVRMLPIGARLAARLAPPAGER